MPAPSLRLADRYLRLEPLADGGQASVFRGRDELTGLDVVIKEVPEAEAEVLRGEFSILARLRHPNLVEVLDLCVLEGRVCLVQSFAPGEDFVSWAARDRSPTRVCPAAAAVARALGAIHARGIVHRDLKPENIRVSDEELAGLPAARLIDFGLATQDAGGETVGTLAYLAPEVLAGEPASPASDLYGLGVVLFEALLGRLPRRELDRLLEESGALASSIAGDAVLGELLCSLLDPLPARRPALPALLEALSRGAGRSLAPTLEHRAGPLLPYPPLVGREAAQARIGEALRAARAGRATLLQLRGCGKSSVANEACLLARTEGLGVWRAAHTAELSSLAPAIVEPTHRVHRIVDQLLAERKRPWLLCLDHFDETDLENGALLEALPRALERGEHAGCVVILASDAAGAGPAWETLALNPLGPASTRELAGQLLHDLPAPLWIDEVYPTTGGDPRSIVELVYAQIAAGLPDSLESSSSREGLVARRVEQLSGDERLVLQALSATLRPVPLELLEQLVPAAGSALRGLIRGGLVIAEERGFAPAHHQARAAALRSAPAEAMQRLHARFAEAWQARAPEARELLGHHWLGAGRPREGAEALVQSGSARRTDLERAAAALDPGDPLWPAVMRGLARALRRRGLDAALEVAARLGARRLEEGALLEAELLLDGGQPGRALEVLGRASLDDARVCLLGGRAQIFLGDPAEAERLAARARTLPGLDRRLAAPVECLLGLAAVYLGRGQEGLEVLARAEALAGSEADRETLVRVHSARGIALQRLGRPREARLAYQACGALARELGDLRAAASAALNLGTLSHQELELGAALDDYRRAGELAHRAGAGTTRVAALSNQANLLLLFGALDGAAAALDEAEALATEVGAAGEQAYLKLYRAELRLLGGDLEGAGSLVEAARSSLSGADRSLLDAVDLLLGEICVQHPLRGSSAARIARELLGRVPWDSQDRWRAHLLAARAALAALPSDLEAARRELELCIALAGAAGLELLCWEAHALAARCLADSGRTDEAAFHAARFKVLLGELRGRLPESFRPSFDARPDLRRAQALLGDRIQPSSSDPSTADLQRLLAINTEINRCLPLDQLLGKILDGAIELTGAERGFVLLGEEELRLAASRNVDGESLRRGMEKLSQTISRLAIQEDRPLVVADAMGDSRFMNRCSISGLRLRAVLCAPFRVRGDGRGALYVDNRFRADAFTPRHVALMASFASQAGIAITNAQLVEELQAQTRELTRTKAQVEAQRGELEAKVAAQSQELTEISVRLRAHEEELVRKYNGARIIGRSRSMCALFASLDRVAEAEVPVLIWGESGTGKELVARAVHAMSARREHPFVCINCGAVAPSLLESELFGHVRGAFTGATRDRPGLFEAAGDGTLFLDEVGDMPPEMQVKLLRILQEGTFRRVGDERERRSSCRILSASHKRLDELMQRGLFREDLYYRLQVVLLEVPPLRERREDIPLLVEHVLAAARPGATVSPAAMAALLDFGWPGNVRQLENELRRAALLCDGTIEPDHLSIPIPSRRATVVQAGGLREELRQHERQVIQGALRQAGGQVAEAARALGLHRVVLYRRMRELGLPLGGASKAGARRTRRTRDDGAAR